MNTAGIIGHKAQLTVISRMINSGHLPHALLFTGKPGIGKKLIAQRIIKTLFCEAANQETPCLACPPCVKVKADTLPDFIEISPDEKGRIIIGSPDSPEPNSVRRLIGRLSKKSVSGRYGVIIDGIDKTGIEGQNALLKTIEEPQEGAVIILIASNRANILPTIVSRSMAIHFNPLDDGELTAVIKEKFSLTPLAILLAGGSVETAALLADPNFINRITLLAAQISAAAEGDGVLTPDLKGLTEKAGAETVLAVLINLFRAALMAAIQDSIPPLPDGITNDAEKLKIIIKILLASEKGLSNNMNLSALMKGLVYGSGRLPVRGFLAPGNFFRSGS